IENTLHWRLDVCLDKACRRNDNAAENMGVVRKWALATLKFVQRKPGEPTKSLRRNQALPNYAAEV
ncbi:MAG: hypothetical protein LBF66_01835, partial [Holosporales bacterium]|nr:hypothetical protein [Holosporales bacterium]